MTPTGGGQISEWAKAGELLLQKRNQAGSIVRLTSPRTGIVYESGEILLFKFCRKGKERRPSWHLSAKFDVSGRLSFPNKRAAKNYALVLPEADPADIKMVEASFRQHMTTTRAYRAKAKEHELLCRGSAFSRGAKWIRDHVSVQQSECLFFPGAVCHAPQSVTYNYQSIAAARAMCLEAYGRPQYASDVVRHKCAMGHMSCVNPNHLTWGSVADNGADRSLHTTSIFDLSEYSSEQLDRIRNDNRMTRVISWELKIPSAAVSAIKLTAFDVVLRGLG